MRDPLTQIRNCQIILQNESFLVFKGKRVFSLSKDNMTLTRYPEIHPYAGKSVFLPDDRVLIQGGSDHCYHILSLKEGRVLASIKLPRQRTSISRNFALSPDGRFAYDHWELKEQKYIIRIDLQAFSYEAFPFTMNLRTMWSIVCTSSNELLVLESTLGHVNDTARTIHELTQIELVNGACRTSCKYRWDAPIKMCTAYADGNYALNKDLKAYDLRTGETIDLIGNTQLPFTQRNGFLGYSYDPETQYLLVYDGNQNDIIDCRSRKLIARYDTSGDSYVGCLVDGQFWLGTADGIVKKPFPIFEDIKRS